jgi:hypothetical protein
VLARAFGVFSPVGKTLRLCYNNMLCDGFDMIRKCCFGASSCLLIISVLCLLISAAAAAFFFSGLGCCLL